MKRINEIVFDYGNTLLLDPFDEIIRKQSIKLRRILASEGYKTRWSRVKKVWIQVNKQVDFPFVSHFYQDERIVKAALEGVGIEQRDSQRLTNRLLNQYRAGFRDILRDDKRRTEVSKTLGYLKKIGLKLAVLSNERQRVLDLSLRLYGIRDFFSLVLSSEKMRMEKPNPSAFNTLLEYLKSRASNTMYVGDDLIRDIIPAKGIGITTVLYIPPQKYRTETSWRNYRHIETEPDFTIKRFSELKQLMPKFMSLCKADS